MTSRRLSALDASFLYGEDQRIPLHVGCLGLMDAAPLRDPQGGVDIARLRAGIQQRLHRVPPFRQRLLEVPLDQGRPLWVDDAAFRIENHVHLTALPGPGTRRQLLDLMGRLQSRLLDRTRPLWELYFVDGLGGGEEIALISKVHHAIIDGTSGVELATLLFDLTPDPPALEAPAWEPEPEPGPAGLLFDALADRANDAVRRSRGLVESLRDLRAPLEGAARFARALESMSGDLDLLPFNDRVGSRRAFETARLPLQQVLDTRKAFGVTVNDVALCAITGALRDYCAEQDLDPDGLHALRALVPVNNRAPEDKRFGNDVSSLFVALPVAEPDPRKRLEHIAERARQLKQLEIADAANLWTRLTSALPTSLLKAAAWFQFRGLMSNANLIVSNVRGPASPLYSFGAQVRCLFPYFGVQDGLGVNVVLVSYAGELLIGVTADPDLMPELDAFVEGIQKAFEELAAAV
jgi:WS/DGAT/MGAT family acyltransferase